MMRVDPEPYGHAVTPTTKVAVSVVGAMENKGLMGMNVARRDYSQNLLTLAS